MSPSSPQLRISIDPVLIARIDNLLDCLARYLSAYGERREILEGDVVLAINSVRSFTKTAYVEPIPPSPARPAS